jgi:hypothetical protein
MNIDCKITLFSLRPSVVEATFAEVLIDGVWELLERPLLNLQQS